MQVRFFFLTWTMLTNAFNREHSCLICKIYEARKIVQDGQNVRKSGNPKQALYVCIVSGVVGSGVEFPC